MVRSRYFYRHRLMRSITAGIPATGWADQVGSPLPQAYSGEILRSPPALVRSLFIPSVWLRTWNREGAPSMLAELKGTVLETPALSVHHAAVRSLTTLLSLLSCLPIHAPGHCQNVPDSLPLGPLHDAPDIFTQGAVAPQPPGTRGG